MAVKIKKGVGTGRSRSGRTANKAPVNTPVKSTGAGRAMSPAQIKVLTSGTTTEVNKLRKKELARRIEALRPEAARRLASFEEKPKLYSPALEKYKKSGKIKQLTKPIGKQKVSQLRGEYIALKKFLNDSTSSVKGAEKLRAERNKMIGGRLPYDLEKTFWDAWDRFKESPGNYNSSSAESDLKSLRMLIYPEPMRKAQREKLKEDIEGNDFNNIIKLLKAKQKADYEAEQQRNQEDDGFDDNRIPGK